MKVAVAVGRRAPLRRRRPRDPADRRPRRTPDRRPRRRRAPGAAGRGRAGRVGARLARRPGRDRRAPERPGGRGAVRRRHAAARRAGESRRSPPRRALPEEVVREWILPAVYERLRTGRGEFLAELRPAFPLFVRFGGIDYDADDDAVGKLDDFVRRVQRILARTAATCSSSRSATKALPLRGLRLAAGARGRRGARRGRRARAASARQATTAAPSRSASPTAACAAAPMATRERRTFVCLGDAVNLAARLMAQAPPGEIYVAEAVRQAGGRLVRLGAARRRSQ